MKVRTAIMSLSLGAGALALSLTATLPSAGASVASATSTPVVHIFGHLKPAPAGLRIPLTHLPHPVAIGNGPDSTKLYQSNNWNGYADLAAKGKKLTNVSAEFNVPSVNCATSNPDPTNGAWTAEWVGLDGFSSASVEQDGVFAYCATAASTPVYTAWYETYPDASVSVADVNAGDAIDVAVGRYKSSNSYLLTLTDVTAGGGFSLTVPCPTGSTCPDTSAEAIMEAPSSSTGILPLADYGLATFGSSQVSANFAPKEAFGASNKSFSLAQINMVSSTGSAESTAYALYGGKFFSTTWVSSGP